MRKELLPVTTSRANPHVCHASVSKLAFTLACFAALFTACARSLLCGVEGAGKGRDGGTGEGDCGLRVPRMGAVWVQESRRVSEPADVGAQQGGEAGRQASKGRSRRMQSAEGRVREGPENKN